MSLLPVANSPLVYYFRLFFHELYSDFPSNRKICVITNSSIIDFTESGWTPYATGTNESVSLNNGTDTSPTYFSAIPTSVISRDIILSRQLIGTKFTLDAQAVFPNRVVYPLMEGIIGAITTDAFSAKIELVSENEKLKTQGKLKISQDCMNTLGIGKCTIPNITITRQVTTIADSGRTVNLATPFIGAFDPLAEYELTIGTTSYIIDKSLSTTSSLRIFGRIAGRPQFVKIRKHCNQSLTQCSKYGNLSQFNGAPFLTASTLNVLL